MLAARARRRWATRVKTGRHARTGKLGPARRRPPAAHPGGWSPPAPDVGAAVRQVTCRHAGCDTTKARISFGVAALDSFWRRVCSLDAYRSLAWTSLPPVAVAGPLGEPAGRRNPRPLCWPSARTVPALSAAPKVGNVTAARWQRDAIIGTESTRQSGRSYAPCNLALSRHRLDPHCPAPALSACGTSREEASPSSRTP